MLRVIYATYVEYVLRNDVKHLFFITND